MSVISDNKRDAALTKYVKAQEELTHLKKSEIDEIRSFHNPPNLVKLVLEAVCTLYYGVKPDWTSVKTVLSRHDFLSFLFDVDKDNIKPEVLSTIEEILRDPHLTEESVKICSKTILSFYHWTVALVEYNKEIRKSHIPEKGEESKGSELNNERDEESIVIIEEGKKLEFPEPKIEKSPSKDKVEIPPIEKDETEKKLERYVAELHHIQDIIHKLNKQDIEEIRSFQHPPQLVQAVLTAVCTLYFDEEPSWTTARTLLSKSDFLHLIFNINKNTIDPKKIEMIRNSLINNGVTSERLKSCSPAVAHFYQWLMAVLEYATLANSLRGMLGKALLEERRHETPIEQVIEQHEHETQ